MEIAEFERAFRAAMARCPQPVLDTPGLSIPVNVQMPDEFRAAAQSLAGRSAGTSTENSLLHAAAQWA